MLPSDQHPPTTRTRKLRPAAKLPTPTVARTLGPADLRCLKRLLSETVEYVPNEFYDRPDAEARFLAPLQDLKLPSEPMPESDDSGIYHLEDVGRPATKPERERALFLRMNYCRMRVFQLCEQFANRRLSGDGAAELLKWKRQATDAQNEIVRENVPLVLAMAKRTRIPGVDISDMISEGNLALLRAVDKFDTARGYKFSTYACRAILKSFSRVATRSARHRGRFPTEFDPTLERSNYIEQRRVALRDDCVDELRAILGENSAELTHVEREVILARFALDGNGKDASRRAKTLEQVGQMIGVTKERVRQIQNKALDKLRVALEDGVLAR